LTHENCPRNALGASHKNAREMVTVVRHGKWVVDGISRGGHRQVRQGLRVASKKDEGRILGQVVEVTRWSRDNARRRLTAASKCPPGAGRSIAKRPRKPRASKYSYNTLKVLQKVWAASGGQCGKYLAASMRVQLDGLQRHGELVFGRDRYSPVVREELLEMSPATIDRYLAPAKAKDQVKGKSKSTTKPSPLLRSSVKIRKATDEIEAAPGFFEGDTVAHCGPTLKGEFARTLNLTCVHTGWTFTRTVRNNAHTHILAGLKTAVEQVPFEVVGLDFGNGTEFLNKAVIAWAGQREIFFTRSLQEELLGHHRVQEQPSGAQLRVLLRLRHTRRTGRAQPAVATGQRPAQLPDPDHQTIGYANTTDGRRRRLYDAPQTQWSGCWPPGCSHQPNRPN
jgi:hypothetical protein